MLSGLPQRVYSAAPAQLLGPSSASGEAPTGLVGSSPGLPLTPLAFCSNHSWPGTGTQVFMGSSVAPGPGLQGSRTPPWEGLKSEGSGFES